MGEKSGKHHKGMVVDVMNHENLLSYFLDGNVATFGGDILLCFF